MSRLWKALRSPQLALGVLAFLAVYSAASEWFPWLRAGAAPAPEWARGYFLDRPFASPLFLAAIGLLFLSTAACTWERTLRVAAIFRGRLRPYAIQLPVRPEGDALAFLRARGFGRPNSDGHTFRFRPALWGGWVLHIGLLALIAGVFVQQGYHDGGAFQIAEGETLRLDAALAVFARDRGTLAPLDPPPLEIELVAFDAFLHQRGYAPDRASRLKVSRSGQAPREGSLDRAAGLPTGGVTIFQAIPGGLALLVEVGGRQRALHLTEVSPTRLTGSFDSPAGRPVVFGLESQRHVDDPVGTGVLSIWYESGLGRVALAPGTPFDFGGAPARLVSVVRWGGFTYSVDPGMPAVFAGFALVLLGATLLTFPAGAAQVTGARGEPAAWVYLTRGREALLAEWMADHGSAGDPPDEGGR